MTNRVCAYERDGEALLLDKCVFGVGVGRAVKTGEIWLGSNGREGTTEEVREDGAERWADGDKERGRAGKREGRRGGSQRSTVPVSSGGGAGRLAGLQAGVQAGRG